MNEEAGDSRKAEPKEVTKARQEEVKRQRKLKQRKVANF